MKKYLAYKLIKWGMTLLNIEKPEGVACSNCGGLNTERAQDAIYYKEIGYHIVENQHWHMSTLCFDCDHKEDN